MMNKKKIMAFALAGVMALGMTGCGSRGKSYSKYVELGEYKGIEYTKTVDEVTDDDVQYEIDNFLNGLAENEEVTGRSVKDGDIVNIDYVGTKDGVEFDGGSAQGYDLTIGSGSFIDGFEDGLIGHDKGEKVSLDLTFPEDYTAEELAGQKVNFAVTINTISEKKVPSLTDDVVKDNTDYDNVDAYKKSVKDNLITQNEDSAEQSATNDIFNKVLENSKVTGYDENEVKKLVDQQFKQFKDMAQSYQSMGYGYADVLAMYGYTSEDELNAGITEYVKSYLDQKMVVYTIANKEGIKVSKQEIEDKVAEYMEQYSSIKDEKELYDYFGEDYFELSILSEKVMSFLKDNAVLVDSTEESAQEETTQEETTQADE